MTYVLLLLSIVAEVFAATMMKLSEGFSKRKETIGMVVGYVVAFYLVSLVMLALPLSITYAIWSGAGTVLTAGIGVMLFNETLGKVGLTGIVLLMSGLMLIHFV